MKFVKTLAIAAWSLRSALLPWFRRLISSRPLSMTWGVNLINPLMKGFITG